MTTIGLNLSPAFDVHLPYGFVAVDPPSGIGLLAVRGAESIAVATTVVDADPDLLAAADTAAGRLAAQVEGLVVLDRRRAGSAAVAALTQILGLGPDAIQAQVFLALPLTVGCVLACLTCTSHPTHAASLAAPFQDTVASFRLRLSPEGSS